MPFIFICVVSLAIFGIASLPSWLREVVFAFGIILITSTVCCFVYLRAKRATKRMLGLSDTTTHTSGSGDGKQNQELPPAPVKQNRQQTLRDAEQATLAEDAFMQDIN